MSNRINIGEIGAFPFSPAASGSAIYLEDTKNLGIPVSIFCHSTLLGTVTQDTPLVVMHGLGAPLRAVIDETLTDAVTLVAYPIK